MWKTVPVSSEPLSAEKVVKLFGQILETCRKSDSKKQYISASHFEYLRNIAHARAGILAFPTSPVQKDKLSTIVDLAGNTILHHLAYSKQDETLCQFLKDPKFKETIRHKNVAGLTIWHLVVKYNLPHSFAVLCKHHWNFEKDEICYLLLRQFETKSFNDMMAVLLINSPCRIHIEAKRMYKILFGNSYSLKEGWYIDNTRGWDASDLVKVIETNYKKNLRIFFFRF